MATDGAGYVSREPDAFAGLYDITTGLGDHASFPGAYKMHKVWNRGSMLSLGSCS